MEPAASTNNCLQQPLQPIDEWAPPHTASHMWFGGPLAVLHAVKALQLCSGIVLTGPTVTHQLGQTVTVQGTGNRRYHVSQRLQTGMLWTMALPLQTRLNLPTTVTTTIDPWSETRAPCGTRFFCCGHRRCPRCNWKAKENLVLSYPGGTTEAVQIGWEKWTTADDNGGSLVDAALRYGLLHPQQLGDRIVVGSPSSQSPPSVYLRLEWCADIHERWRLILRLACPADVLLLVGRPPVCCLTPRATWTPSANACAASPGPRTTRT